MIDRYRIAAEWLTVLALVLAAAWGWHTLCEHQREIGRAEVRGEWKRAEDAAVLADAKLAAEREKNVNQAVAQGVQRETVIKTLAASSAASAAGLRDTINAIKASNSAVTIETLINRANTAGDLLGDCAARYRSVAEKADRHANDARTLSDAWPTK